MSKAVLISIRPEWCEKIANGQKTIEIRKTCPKIETPFKCFIYETQHANRKKWINLDNPYRRVAFAKGRGQVIGEFICDRVERYGEDTEYGKYYMSEGECRNACLTNGDIGYYAQGKDVYGWHISDLVIYDKPKELSDFCTDSSVFTFDDEGNQVYTGMKRPPQSWCYVEEMK